MNIATITPIQKRITALDVLRGFALFGVLLVNMLDFSSSALRTDTIGARGNELDQLIDIAIAFFAITKFYLLFSFLFGIGFAVQMMRMAAKNRPFIGFYLRRLLILLAIGFAHAVLLWDGDILRLYAVAGVLLLVVRNWPDRVLLGLAGVITLAGLVIFSLVPYEATITMSNTDSLSLFMTGSYGDLVAHRFSQPMVLDIQIPMVLVMFLVGLVVGRSGVLDDPQRYQPILRRWWKWVLPFAFLCNGLFLAGFEARNMAMVSIGIHVGAPLLSFVYVAWVLMYAEKLTFLAPVGQLALTNYLSQSLIATTLFYSYGFGLYDQILPTQMLMLVLVIFAGQIVFSHSWLVRYQFGPMEWLWRSLTYGQWQELRRHKILQKQK